MALMHRLNAGFKKSSLFELKTVQLLLCPYLGLRFLANLPNWLLYCEYLGS